MSLIPCIKINVFDSVTGRPVHDLLPFVNLIKTDRRVTFYYPAGRPLTLQPPREGERSKAPAASCTTCLFYVTMSKERLQCFATAQILRESGCKGTTILPNTKIFQGKNNKKVYF